METSKRETDRRTAIEMGRWGGGGGQDMSKRDID